jgi:hypothetical protein
MAWSFYFRIAIFVAHAVTALVFLLWTTDVIGPSPCGPRVSTAYYPVTTGGNMDLLRFPVTIAAVSKNCSLVTTTLYGLLSWDVSSVRCVNMDVQPEWDVPFDPASYVPGSSWNILVTILVFEWITSSFALYYVDPGDWIASIIPGVHITPVVCTVWNLVLLVVLWSCRATMQVTSNNLFIFSLCLVYVIVVQNYMARYKVGVVLPAEVLVERTETKFVWQTDQFIRRRPQYRGATVGGKLDDVSGTDPYYDLKYAENLDLSGEGPVVRFLEYMVTAPLLIVCLYIFIGGSGLVWTYQAVFMALCICNAMGIPLHYVVASLATYRGADSNRMVVAGWSALVASWLAWAAGFFVYIYTSREYLLADPSSTSMPAWVLALLWLVLLFYSSFGIVITALYVPVLMGGAVGSRMATAVWFLDLLSPTIKLSVALVVWSKGTGTNCLFDSSHFSC